VKFVTSLRRFFALLAYILANYDNELTLHAQAITVNTCGNNNDRLISTPLQVKRNKSTDGAPLYIKEEYRPVMSMRARESSTCGHNNNNKSQEQVAISATTKGKKHNM
jgi:hypothetical protein